MSEVTSIPLYRCIGSRTSPAGYSLVLCYGVRKPAPADFRGKSGRKKKKKACLNSLVFDPPESFLRKLDVCFTAGYLLQVRNCIRVLRIS